MIWTIPYHGNNKLEIALITVFTILFAWISIGFFLGLYGFIIRLWGKDRLSLLHRHPPKSLQNIPLVRTAVVMPIYHEPIERTFLGIQAIYKSLEVTGLVNYFDFFILSDSHDPNIWLTEQATWYKLCKQLNADGKLFYRRRRLNINHKSGNIADFMRRWGRYYDYTIILDADSLMDGNTLVHMVRLMQVEPTIGIIQTSPSIINGKSLFARGQQFANRVYGPIFTTGLAALQLGEAVYWGHNAIIRTHAFIKNCGIKRLPGWGLFSGSILSHDFVESAYMGRAGYEIWLEPNLLQSYEESPPTLVDELRRDKRWSKGNLQHVWLLLFSRNLKFAHRLAFLNGIMAYCSSPLWLLFLILMTIEATRLILWPINYFPKPHSLYPVWPEWHPHFAMILITSTIFLLFIPKFFAVFDILLNRKICHYGGGFHLLCGIMLESIMSILLAPIRMLTHTKYVFEALFNVSIHWTGQNRTRETDWWDAIINQAPGTIIAATWAGFTYWLNKMFFFWSLPVAIPLILAAPISVFLARISLGQKLRHLGFLIIPEELHSTTLTQDITQYTSIHKAHKILSPFALAVLHPILNRVHWMLAYTTRDNAKQSTLQNLRMHCLHQGIESLTKKELNYLAQDQESLQWLHEQAWKCAPDSYWAKAIANLNAE